MRPEERLEIRRQALFAAMTDEAFETLVHAAYLQVFPPHVQLLSEGDAPAFLHVLLEGSVEMFANWNRRETTIAMLQPVATFIPAAVITDRTNLMSARTLTKSRIALIPAQAIRQAFDEDAHFARAMANDLAVHFRTLTRHVKELKLRTSIERLAAHLLRLDAEAGKTGRFSFTKEKRQIAGHLGMTPESFSRALARLRDYGVIVDQNDVTLTSTEEVRRLAKPTPMIDDAEDPSPAG